MIFHSLKFRAAITAIAALTLSSLVAEEPVSIILQNGTSIPISAVTLQGDKLVLGTAAAGFPVGQALPLEAADHIYGDKPEELKKAIALLLMGRQGTALRQLEPIMEAHKITAKIPGNFWLEAARAALVAYALEGNSSKCSEIGQAISDATPAQGQDLFVKLGKVILMPATTEENLLQEAYLDLISDDHAAEVSAYASYFYGVALKKLKKDKEALEAYLSVQCLYPTGGLILSAAAQYQSAELLVSRGLLDEARLLFKAAALQSLGTTVAEEANKRLEALK